MAVEPWEYGAEEEEKPKKSQGLGDFVYVGILIIALVAAVAFYQQGGIKIYFIVSMAVFIGALFAVFSSKSTDAQKLVTTFGFAGAILLFMFVVPASLKADIQSGVSSLTNVFPKENPLNCIDNPSQCTQQYYNYDSANIRSTPKIYLDAKAQATSINQDQPVAINVDITAINQVFDNLNVNAKCFLDGKEISAEPQSFLFKKMDEQQSSTLTCKGDYQAAKELIVKLEADYKAETLLPIEVGKGPNAGKLISSMQYDSPYKLSVSLGYNQPLTEAKTYIMPVNLDRQTFSIKELKSLKISTKKTGVAINCDDIPGLEITSLNRDALRKFLINSEKDNYQFRCNLIVDEVPEYAQNAYIESEAIYSAESEYKTSLTINTNTRAIV